MEREPVVRGALALRVRLSGQRQVRTCCLRGRVGLSWLQKVLREVRTQRDTYRWQIGRETGDHM